MLKSDELKLNIVDVPVSKKETKWIMNANKDELIKIIRSFLAKIDDLQQISYGEDFFFYAFDEAEKAVNKLEKGFCLDSSNRNRLRMIFKDVLREETLLEDKYFRNITEIDGVDAYTLFRQVRIGDSKYQFVIVDDDEDIRLDFLEYQDEFYEVEKPEEL